MEIAGCTGKKKQARKQGEEETGVKEEVFFFFNYVNFYFLNEGYFGYFIELLGAPTILLGAPSNAQLIIVVWALTQRFYGLLVSNNFVR